MPEPIIDKVALEHLARLARLHLAPSEEESLLKDLAKILDYFGELKALDTANIEPMSGATRTMNVFREDTERENTDQGAGTESFPDTREEFLKIPPVFE